MPLLRAYDALGTNINMLPSSGPVSGLDLSFTSETALGNNRYLVTFDIVDDPILASVESYVRLRDSGQAIVQQLTFRTDTGSFALTFGEVSIRWSDGNWPDFEELFDGEDQIYGAGYNDVLRGFAGDDRIEGQGGRDTLLGGVGDDKIFGGSEKDRLEGGAGADTLSGDTGGDSLSGGAGRDVLRGGAGDDRLEGGGGRDVMKGGGGADAFVFALGSGRDRVQDFDAETDDLVFDRALRGTLDITHKRGDTHITYGDEGDKVVLKGVELLFRDLDLVFSDLG